MKFLFAMGLGLLMAVSAAAKEKSYVGRAPQPDGLAAWRLVLLLQDNGSATLHTAKTSSNRMIENAVWTTNPDGNLSLQFLNFSGRPRGVPLVMKPQGTELIPQTWDKASWGAIEPPVLTRG